MGILAFLRLFWDLLWRFSEKIICFSEEFRFLFLAQTRTKKIAQHLPLTRDILPGTILGYMASNSKILLKGW
jgi:hypothetical protein